VEDASDLNSSTLSTTNTSEHRTSDERPSKPAPSRKRKRIILSPRSTDSSSDDSPVHQFRRKRGKVKTSLDFSWSTRTMDTGCNLVGGTIYIYICYLLFFFAHFAFFFYRTVRCLADFTGNAILVPWSRCILIGRIIGATECVSRSVVYIYLISFFAVWLHHIPPILLHLYIISYYT